MTLAGSPGVVQALPVQKSEFPPNRNSHCLSPEAWGGIQDAWQNLAWSLLQVQWLYFVPLKWDMSCKFQAPPRQELIHQSQHYSATAWHSTKPRPPSNSRVEEFCFFLNVVLSNVELLPISLRNPTCAQVCTHTHTHTHTHTPIFARQTLIFFPHQLAICFKLFDVNPSVKLNYKQQGPDFRRGEEGVILNNRSFFAPGNNLQETWGKMNVKPSCP